MDFEIFENTTALPIFKPTATAPNTIFETDKFTINSTTHSLLTKNAEIEPLVLSESYNKKKYNFELDTFQKMSLSAIERNENLLISAHTSAGKTVIAEYAIAHCVLNNQRCIYTSPIKALSNQKYRELSALCDGNNMFNARYYEEMNSKNQKIDVDSIRKNTNNGINFSVCNGNNNKNSSVDKDCKENSLYEPSKNNNIENNSLKQDPLKNNSSINEGYLRNNNSFNENESLNEGSMHNEDLFNNVSLQNESGFSASVGLLTGDVTINPNASILVMTTEILRNMLYRGSTILKEVNYVIFDEIHYLKDQERGVVWEEAIILSPAHFRFVFLSATIPNAVEFGSWIVDITGMCCHLVSTNRRPTPLEHYLWIRDRPHLILYDKKEEQKDNNSTREFNNKSIGETTIKDVNSDTKECGLQPKSVSFDNPSIIRPIQTNTSTSCTVFDAREYLLASKNILIKRRLEDSDINSIVSYIKQENLLPTIIFAFSRKECEKYALGLQNDFLTEPEKQKITQIFTSAISGLKEEEQNLDLIQKFLPHLKQGIGIHHAGLLPIIKEIVEILFQENLLKVLFATETFSIGLNMPAKCVVFTNLKKFDGEEKRLLKSGEYIQMSGRAGRRNLDKKGLVFSMVNEHISFKEGKKLFSGLADTLDSAFRLSYNMILNLMRVVDYDPVYLIKRSFFYFQSQNKLRDVVEKINGYSKVIDGICSTDETFLRYIEQEKIDECFENVSQNTFENNNMSFKNNSTSKPNTSFCSNNEKSDKNLQKLSPISDSKKTDNQDAHQNQNLVSAVIFGENFLKADLTTNLSILDPFISRKLMKIKPKLTNILQGYIKLKKRKNYLKYKYYLEENLLQKGRLVDVIVNNEFNIFIIKYCKIKNINENYIVVEFFMNKLIQIIKIKRENLETIYDVMAMNFKALREAIKSDLQEVKIEKFMKNYQEKPVTEKNVSKSDKLSKNNSKSLKINEQNMKNQEDSKINSDFEELSFINNILDQIETNFGDFLFLNSCLLCKKVDYEMDCLNGKCLDQKEIEEKVLENILNLKDEKQNSDKNKDSFINNNANHNKTSTTNSNNNNDSNTNNNFNNRDSVNNKYSYKNNNEYNNLNSQKRVNPNLVACLNRNNYANNNNNNHGRNNHTNRNYNYSNINNPNGPYLNRNNNSYRNHSNSDYRSKREQNETIYKDLLTFNKLHTYLLNLKYIQFFNTLNSDLKTLKQIYHLNECKKMIQVLRRLSYYDKQITIKGRVACEISTAFELLLVELIFNNAFETMPIDQIVALLSCLVFHEIDNQSSINLINKKNYNNLIELMKKLIHIMNGCGIDIKVDDYIKRYSWEMMDIAQAWVNGKSFVEICAMSDIFEGSIIRCFRRLEELLKQLCSAAREIGNSELENLFAEGIVKIKRDIVFSSSLYV